MAKVEHRRETGASMPDPDGDPHDEPTAPGSDAADRLRTRRRLNLLGALLVAALTGSLVLSLALWIELARIRTELGKRQAAEETVRAAAPQRGLPAAAQSAISAPADPTPAAALAPAPPPAATHPVADDRLLLLLTVGTRHFAEKQLGLLRQQCKAPLAVYLQRRGRCAWAQCYAVAARELDSDLARECGKIKGQALRERGDFILVQ
jgi:hypothetical protein